MTTYEFTYNGVPIAADFYPAEGAGRASILYFHGGGLLYGQRGDLDPSYIRAITQRGYHLLCLDYLLAPESPLDQIHASVDRALEWYLSARTGTLGLGACPFLLFGRSAGAYLALCLAHRLALRGGEQPLALWSFYGYHSLLHPFFSSPSPYYRSLPRIGPDMIPSFDHGAPRSSASIESRFYLYVYARQQGRWLQFLSSDPARLARFSIPDEALGQLPPAFLTASTADRDVPFSFSKKLSRLIPSSYLLQVFGLEHDYDRDPALPESQSLYRSALDWLERL